MPDLCTKGSCLHSGMLEMFSFGFVYQIFRYVVVFPFFTDIFMPSLICYAPLPGEGFLVGVNYVSTEVKVTP